MRQVETIRVTLLCVAVCIIVIVVGVALREEKTPIVVQTEKPGTDAPQASIALNDFTYSSVNSSNVKEWSLQAAAARHYPAANRIELQDLVVQYFRDNGTAYRLSGSRGELNTKTRNLSVSGGVSALLPDNTTIRTESLYYDHEQRIIRTEDCVTIDRGTVQLEGTGMVVDLERQKLSLLGNVQALGGR